MADRSLRGIRLGAQSLQSEDGVVFMERAQFTYKCTQCGRDTVLNFAADAEAPAGGSASAAKFRTVSRPHCVHL